MNQITDRGTQKRLHTKFHTINIMKSESRVIKQSISRACRNHAFGIHESRHSPLVAKKFVDANLKIKIQKYKIIKNY